MSEYVTITMQGETRIVKERETAKAYLVAVECEATNKVHFIWLPKSQVRMKTQTQMEVPTWLIDEKEKDHRTRFTNII